MTLRRRDRTGASRGAVLGGLAVVAALVLVVVLGSRQGNARPYDVRSTAPDGYAALAELLRDRGAEVDGRSAARAASAADADAGPGDVVFVPVPALASAFEIDAFDDAAEAGAVVVYGTPPLRPFDPEADVLSTDVLTYPARLLADTPAEPVAPGRCDIDELDGLGDIDGAFATPVPASGGSSCYGAGAGALVLREPVGASGGAVVTLAAPELLVNARLQPDKEDGGQPLDNAAVALRLFGPPPTGAGPGVRVVFVDPVPSAGAAVDGARNPVELLPLGVQLALAMGVAAFVLYAWFRSRRLGVPVRERVPVEIAGSELVVAVGDLLRRKGSADRAAATMRTDTRRALSRRLGVPPTAPPSALVEVVADRTGRDPHVVAAVLVDGPVGSADGLVRLARSLDELRQEVLHEPVPG